MANNTVTDQRTASLPPDAVFRAGLPVSGRLFALQVQVERQLYEALYDEAAPGQDSQTIDSAATEEYRKAQDHSGIVEGVSHGAFLGRSFPLGLPPRFPVMPFDRDGWADPDGVDTTLVFHGESQHPHAPARMMSYSGGGGCDIIYAGHAMVNLRRGTTHLDVQAGAWQVSDASLDPGKVVAAVFDAGWQHIATESTAVDIAESLTENPLEPAQHLCVAVTADGAPLTQDLWCYLVIGLTVDAFGNGDYSLLLHDLLAWERQIPV